jgi:hypothetical protein
VPAVSVNDGAIYTNTPDVTVTVYCPRVASARLSHTAGQFAGSSPMRVFGLETHLPWRLDTLTATRDVKRVHLRFTPMRAGESFPEIFDDIILDQRPPEVVTALITGSRLKLKARDNRSGVKRVQVTTNRKKPGKARGFSSRVKLSGRPRSVHVRVLDGAGNRSKWRVARRP